jgi:hypothetical protein
MRFTAVAVPLIMLAVLGESAAAFEPPGIFPPRILETFDDFPDGYELSNTYPTLSPGPPIGATVTSSNDLYPGIQGKAAEFDPFLTFAPTTHRIQNEELSILTPDIFGPLTFRADIFDDGISEFKRAVVSIRHLTPGSPIQNVIQVGISPLPGFPFGHLQTAMLDNPVVGWQRFTLPEHMDERPEIGPGWHRFSVTITMAELVYQLDLHRDGTVDAENIVPVILHPTGFNEMRFARLPPIAEPSFIAVDNLFLGVIPEPAAMTLATVGLIVLGSQRRRLSS